MSWVAGKIKDEIIEPIRDVGRKVDDFVNEEIPGGWATVAAAAGGGYLASTGALSGAGAAGAGAGDLAWMNAVSPSQAAAIGTGSLPGLGYLPGLALEPVLVPGDSLLSSTLATPPLSVETISGALTPEASALLPSETLTGGLIGNADKAALLGNTGYGPGLVSGEAPILESVATSMGPGKDVTGLQVAKDIVTSLPGASKQYLTTALTTLGLNPDLVNNIVGWSPSTTASSTTQTGGGSNFLGPIIGGLLSRQQQSAPSPGLIQGKGVDITSPIQSLLAPKLVQQRPVSLL